LFRYTEIERLFQSELLENCIRALFRTSPREVLNFVGFLDFQFCREMSMGSSQLRISPVSTETDLCRIRIPSGASRSFTCNKERALWTYHLEAPGRHDELGGSCHEPRSAHQKRGIPASPVSRGSAKAHVGLERMNGGSLA
jgi:hypothetical protein